MTWIPGVRLHYNNSLVFFPSDYFHEVLQVHAHGDAFENARFTVNGWLHTMDYFSYEPMSSGARAIPRRAASGGTRWRPMS